MKPIANRKPIELTPEKRAELQVARERILGPEYGAISATACEAKQVHDALAAMRSILARDIVQDRERIGWSQAELARRAGIRVETLNRIENGKHSPSVATIQKIDIALHAATKRKPRSPRSG